MYICKYVYVYIDKYSHIHVFSHISYKSNFDNRFILFDQDMMLSLHQIL